MKIFEQEIDARECTPLSNASSTSRGTQPRVPTAAALIANNSGPTNTNVTCAYCGQSHLSASCTTIVDLPARKEALQKSGRCYVCLKKHHLSKDCRSNLRCQKCRGRHHVTICSRQDFNTSTPPVAPQGSSNETSSGNGPPSTTSSLYAGTQNPILLQTAQLKLSNPTSGRPGTVARAIMDSGSQRTYITCRFRDELDLPTTTTESLRIKTFGNTESYDSACDVVELALDTKDHGTLKITALVVPAICHPLTSQPISRSQECYDHFIGLELADSADASDALEVDILIGSDWYWSLATGRVIKGRSGPIAVHTKVGWVLSGPTNHRSQSHSHINPRPEN